jgi:hypothetical protein
MPTIRPLPSRPSLEYERKQAKLLLRELRAGKHEALERASALHAQFHTTDATHMRLADAQLIIAREYGFASWPRLVRYFQDVERQQHGHAQLHWGRDHFEAEARSMLAGHGRRSTRAGRALAAYVPRFYGFSVDEVFAHIVSDDDARLAVARLRGAPSWAVLLERLESNARTRPRDWEVDPMREAIEAMAQADVSALERVVAAHPQLLTPSEFDISTGRTLMWMALGKERKLGKATMLPIMEWLAAHGFDRQRELNMRLCGHIRVTTEEVRKLLDLGADPNWVAPSGIPVLEHALMRYWNGEAVDVLAARTTPRKALWIAAGLGDVEGVRNFLDRDGNPTSHGRQLRPDFIAVGGPGFMPALPDADDEEVLLEALLVALLNGRTNVLEYMASRGAPLNSVIYGNPLIHIAVGNAMTAVVESLLRCRADLDIRGANPNMTARELAHYMFEQNPRDAERRRVAELCGIDPDAVLALPASPPVIDRMLQQALLLASDDAARQGKQDVGPENLLIGLLRVGGPSLYFLKEVGRMDVERFSADLSERLSPNKERVARSELPMDEAAQAAMDAAIAFATSRRREEVYSLHLLHGLTRHDDGAVGQLLRRYGVSAAKINAELDRAL